MRSPSPVRRTAVLVGTTAVALSLALPAAAQDGTSFRTAQSTDPTLASVLISQDHFQPGDADWVVIGRNDVFADNLGGAALAAAAGPLLLTDPTGPLRDEVLDEVARVLDPPDVACDTGRVHAYVLGGTAAISEEAVQQLEQASYCVERLWGASRVETSVAIAAEILSFKTSAEQPQRGQLLVARDDNPADSASAGAYASGNFVPIVVTQGTQLHPAVAELLQPGDGSWDSVVLLGGTAALSDGVEQQIAEAANGGGFDVPVTRAAGATRDDTAFVIATELWPQGERPARTASIVNGFSPEFWTYALPGGVAAAVNNGPLLYVHRDLVPEPTDTYLRQFPVEYLVTVGPEEEISTTTQEAAEASLGSGA